MKSIIKLFQAFLILLSCLIFLLFFSYITNADETIKLEEIKISYKGYFDGTYEPLINQNGMGNRNLAKELSLYVDNTLFKYGYFNNQVLSYTDKDAIMGDGERFRLVGWSFELGVHLWSSQTNGVDIYYNHFSKHYLDYQSPYRYPVSNSIGINIYLYKSNPKYNGVF